MKRNLGQVSHILFWAAMVAPGCSTQTVNLENRACDSQGECLAGYVCNTDYDICGKRVSVGCSGETGELCPSEITTGDDCPSAYTQVPCADDAVNCDGGCRTCLDGAWSACPCEITNSGVEKCDGLDNDCDGVADNNMTVGEIFAGCEAEAIGVTHVQNDGWACVDGACANPTCEFNYWNADNEALNGCEYECTQDNGGDETCDDEDNDCNNVLNDMTQAELNIDCEQQTALLHVADYSCATNSCTIATCDPGWVGDTCDDPCAVTTPDTEVCDGADNDCDGGVDNIVPGSDPSCVDFYYDEDNDTYGIDSDVRCYCVATDLYRATQGGDCDDTDATEKPGVTWYPDADGDLYGDDSSAGNACERAAATDVTDNTDCDDDTQACGSGCYPTNPAPDLCDSYDQDCDTLVDEDASGYFAFAKTITIDRTKVGVSGTSAPTLSDFPMLVSLTDMNLRTEASDPVNGRVQNANGWDIIFEATDDTTCGAGSAPCTLDHEVEQYEPTTGELVAWVRLPSVNTNLASTDTVFFIRYSDPAISASLENAAGVWDASFQAVLHLEEDPSGGSPQIEDSAHVNDGTMNGGMVAGDQVAGQIAGSLDFDGTNDWFNLGDDASLHLNNSTSMTWSAWINTRGSSAHQNILRYDELDGDGSNPRDLYLFRLTSSSELELTYGDSDSLSSILSTATVSNDTWYHVVAVRDVAADTETLYIDGSLDNSETDTSTGTWETTGQYAMLGRYQNGSSSEFFNGLVDEVRVSDIARDADWIETEFNNQKWPDVDDHGADGFFTVGAEEARGCP